MNLILENVRCFTGKHSIPITPLTFLTGQNSSGKSTLMGMFAAVSSLPGYPLRPNFDSEPYHLGTYDTIATYKGGKYGRARHFSLGLEEDDYRVDTTYRRSDSGLANVAKLDIAGPSGHFAATVTGGVLDATFTYVSSRRAKSPILFKVNLPPTGEPQYARENFFFHTIWRGLEKNNVRSAEAIFHTIAKAFEIQPRISSIAPIRTRPRRTYDKFVDLYSPEGDHIPNILSRMLTSTPGSLDSERANAVVEFGIEAGLFKKIGIRRLGRLPSDPFQIRVTVSGRSANLHDVGYGISQSLPIVVQSILTAKRQWLLLQQPEVHLHPQAQAGLGTFFVRMAAKGGKRFLIETHSDYMIDRVRQEIAAGNIKASDVTIVFLDKPESETSVFPLTLDDAGNILDPPPSYREFFLREEMNLLNRERE
ncbi:MAG: AAA family ATPase [Phycisphaerae bacterium]|jgi:predicted ATPase